MYRSVLWMTSKGELSRQVLGDENLAITTDERVPGDTIVRKDFTVQDYILDNLR